MALKITFFAVLLHYKVFFLLKGINLVCKKEREKQRKKKL